MAVWSSTTRRGVMLRGHTGAVHTAVFSPDSRQLVTTSRDGTARIWDAASGRLEHVLDTRPTRCGWPRTVRAAG